MTYAEAIDVIKNNWPDERYTMLREALEIAIRELTPTQDGQSFCCEYCKHMVPSGRMNRLYCLYHSEGGNQYETHLEDYCSYYEAIKTRNR